MSHVARSSLLCLCFNFLFFFFNDPATPAIYTLSLHDALPICRKRSTRSGTPPTRTACPWRRTWEHGGPLLQRHGPVHRHPGWRRSEEHTSELQSRSDLVCRLLLEKKKKKKNNTK